MKKVLKYFLTYLIVFLILLSVFILATSIPKKAIKANLNKTLTYINQQKLHTNIVKNNYATRTDLYADIIILNLAASQNNKKPLTSLLASKYYDNHLKSEKANLKAITNNNYQPNEEYLRYWHGSISIIKPLLVLFSLQGIQILNYLLIISLTIVLLLILYKKYKLLSLITLLSLLVTYSFFVPLTLEYTWTYIIMLITSIIAIKLIPQDNSKLYLLFFITGMVTCFFDFLTTETLTFVLPLTLVTILRYHNKNLTNQKEELLFIVKSTLLWGLSYLLMWLTKWLFSAVYLHLDVLKTILYDAKYRAYGPIAKDMFTQITGALLKNISCLMPFSFLGKLKEPLCLITIIILGSYYFLYRKAKQPLIIKLLFIIGFIPLLRFILISNHAYIHYFFTYRALLPSIICLIFIFIYGIDKKLLKK